MGYIPTNNGNTDLYGCELDAGRGAERVEMDSKAHRLDKRIKALDDWRGVAVGLMIVDHVWFVTGLHEWRTSITRLALPMFFVVSGMLLRSGVCNERRGLLLVCLGLLMPVAVPWIDNPNVLLWIGLGGLVLPVIGAVGELVIVIVGLTMQANGYGVMAAGYSPYGLLGLMVIGMWFRDIRRMVPEVPGAVFGLMGRYALGIYVGHLLVLEGVRQWQAM